MKAKKPYWDRASVLRGVVQVVQVGYSRSRAHARSSLDWATDSVGRRFAVILAMVLPAQTVQRVRIASQAP